MMEHQYSPSGWLGLLLGTRLFYRFHDSAIDTDEKFNSQMDAVVREIGERGKPGLLSAAAAPPEGLPPTPAPAPEPAATQLRTPAASTRSFTPSMQLATSPAAEASGSFAELALFFREERRHLEAQVEAQRQETEKQRQENQRLREDVLAAKAHDGGRREAAAPRVPREQLAALLARLAGAHAARLLSDEELWSLEDLIADHADHAPSSVAAAKVAALAGVAAAFADDAALARQVRRKVLT